MSVHGGSRDFQGWEKVEPGPDLRGGDGRWTRIPRLPFDIPRFRVGEGSILGRVERRPEGPPTVVGHLDGAGSTMAATPPCPTHTSARPLANRGRRRVSCRVLSFSSEPREGRGRVTSPTCPHTGMVCLGPSVRFGRPSFGFRPVPSRRSTSGGVVKDEQARGRNGSGRTVSGSTGRPSRGRHPHGGRRGGVKEVPERLGV